MGATGGLKTAGTSVNPDRSAVRLAGLPARVTADCTAGGAPAGGRIPGVLRAYPWAPVVVVPQARSDSGESGAGEKAVQGAGASRIKVRWVRI